MKKRLLSLAAVIPLLASCGEKDPLVIPTVDVESMTISLPAKPVYNQGDIRTDGTYDYIDLYETSDVHGAVYYETHDSGDYLGLAKIATYIDGKREQNPGGTILLSSGDMFQGSADSNLTRGYMVNYCMNYMGYESMTLGNHEFDWSTEWIKKNANLSYEGHKIPYLAANLIETSTGNMPEFVQKSVIVERGDYKIGIVGTIGEELKGTILASAVAGYDFTSEKTAVESEAAALRGQGCDIVVWSSHNNVEVLPIVEGVDAIFGGHAHLDKKTEKGVIPAVATSNYGRSIAHIELKINKSTKEVTPGDYGYEPSEGTLNTLSGLAEKSDIKTIISSYDEEIGKIKNIKLGECSEVLESDQELKYICVDAMQKGAKKANEELGLGIPEDHIIAAYHNVSGGIRADIQSGSITYNDVYKPFPFDNEICFIKFKGKDYKKKATGNSFASWAVWHSFKKLTEVKDDEDYYLVFTDFMALSENYLKSPGLFPEIGEADLIRTGKVVREEIANYIYDLGSIDSSNFTSKNPNFKTITLY